MSEAAGKLEEAAQGTETAANRKQQFLWIFGAIAIVLIADQVTKAIVMATIEENRPIDRDEVFFQFTHQRNEGLVGGMFRNSDIIPKVMPVFATFVLLYLFRFLDPAARIQSLAYGMVFGGAIGNLTDRVRLGSVTDFLQFHFYFIPFDLPWRLYPAFNIADSAICVGVVTLVLMWNVSPQPGRNAARTS